MANVLDEENMPNKRDVEDKDTEIKQTGEIIYALNIDQDKFCPMYK